ncbi:hypothetical protein K505DRAFT_53727 [Melanomma pulvis-pyrius CBS 109.77]|uniref:Uncharacterized protein n=1 Tax=Melanomma pulvis-pyrius CBS 109.77 TaxID=1314802 RepID=A0A6A6X8F2_9PLEO|nr:hypothetical protein K505DRAFT_53727 [Melanomma pulvis-pyrius CBS 109.77]
MMAAPGGFNFLRHAEARKCHSRKARHMLLSKGVPKNEQQIGIPTIENILITTEVLESALSQGKLYTALRCDCSICLPVTERTPPEDDISLAAATASRPDRQQLFATLAFVGGTFAARLLHKHAFHTVEDTIRGMPDRTDLMRALFLPFRSFWDPKLCYHAERHTRDTYLFCLQEDFLAQLRSEAWIIRVPEFQANNLLQHFGERVNTPFIQEKRLPISNRGNGREFFSFVVHPSYCDEKLQVRDSRWVVHGGGGG